MIRPALLALFIIQVAHAETLQERLDAIAKTQPPMTLGIVVARLGDKESSGVNRERAFPLASTFKLPLAIVALQASEQGKLPPLDGKVRLLASDMHPGVSPLRKTYPQGGELTLRALLVPLLEESDNSAADGLLRMLGGGAKVTAALRAMGLDGISIDRSEAEIGRATHGETPTEKRAALDRLRQDPRDHASPAALARIVERLWSNVLPLTAEHARFLREEMLRCHTGARRLRAGLPPNTPFGDRTGTCDGPSDDAPVCANDFGVLQLPSGKQVAIAVMIEDAGQPLSDKERVMQSVARAVWQHYAHELHAQ
jgi:beta-lactamase class A